MHARAVAIYLHLHCVPPRSPPGILYKVDSTQWDPLYQCIVALYSRYSDLSGTSSSSSDSSSASSSSSLSFSDGSSSSSSVSSKPGLSSEVKRREADVIAQCVWEYETKSQARSGGGSGGGSGEGSGGGIGGGGRQRGASKKRKSYATAADDTNGSNDGSNALARGDSSGGPIAVGEHVVVPEWGKAYVYEVLGLQGDKVPRVSIVCATGTRRNILCGCTSLTIHRARSVLMFECFDTSIYFSHPIPHTLLLLFVSDEHALGRLRFCDRCGRLQEK